MNLKESKKAILRGIELLNRKIPNWYKEINLSIFDINYPCYCVLGQISESYKSSCHNLNIYSRNDEVYYGFFARDIDNTKEWFNLQILWINEISKLQYKNKHK